MLKKIIQNAMWNVGLNVFLFLILNLLQKKFVSVLPVIAISTFSIKHQKLHLLVLKH